MPHEQIEDSYQEETCDCCGGPLGDDAPLYEDADICMKCHIELEEAEAAGSVCTSPECHGRCKECPAAEAVRG